MIEMLDPKTLTVFITGASAGFGEATCRRFAQAGARVVAAGRRDDIAEMIFWTCTLPRHLNINRMQMMPVMQAFGPFQFARK